MRLERHLDKTLVFTGVRATDKDDLLRHLAELTARRLPVVDAASLRERLRKREAGSSTGIGAGIAVPHTSVEGLDRPVCVLAQLEGGVDFGAIDQAPVGFLFLLLSPPEAIGHHLRLLARIARLLHSPGFAEALQSPASADQLYQLVVDEDVKHAT